MTIPIGHRPLSPYGANDSSVTTLILQCQCHEHGRNTFSVSSRYRAPAIFSSIRDVRDGAKAGRQCVDSAVQTRAGCGRPRSARSSLLWIFDSESPEGEARLPRRLRVTLALAAYAGGTARGGGGNRDNVRADAARKPIAARYIGGAVQ
jgi:hypothetical protein